MVSTANIFIFIFSYVQVYVMIIFLKLNRSYFLSMQQAFIGLCSENGTPIIKSLIICKYFVQIPFSVGIKGNPCECSAV